MAEAPNKGANSKLTDEARVKVKEVAALDGTVEEMAYYCGVTRQTIYNWFKEDTELFDEVERLRERPVLKARQTIAKSLEDPKNAQWYLERKKKIEFAQRSELTGDKGKDIEITFVNYGDNKPTIQAEAVPTESSQGL